jgi:hypothetical protein
MANWFWVGSSGTWDATSTTHWSSVSGGTGGGGVPASGDNVTLDGNSGGGTVTLNVSTGVTIAQFTMDAFTGTVDNSVNNNTWNATGFGNAFSAAGSATQTLKMGTATYNYFGGNGSFQLTGSNLTLNASLCTINMGRDGSNLGGNQTLTVASGAALGTVIVQSSVYTDTHASPQVLNISGSSRATVTNLILNPGANFFLGSSGWTVTNSFNSQNCLGFNSPFYYNGQALGITVPTNSQLQWGMLTGFRSTSVGVSATNSFDWNSNTGISITGPSGGGGGIIGS